MACGIRATLTQVSSDMLSQFRNTLHKFNEGYIHFNSAVHSTKTKVTLYEARQVVLIHMESGVTTEPAKTKIICNRPELVKGTMLLGLGSLKDLQDQDDRKRVGVS